MNHTITNGGRLMKGQLWASMFFTECSRPSNKTLRSWINGGVIEGEFVGNNAEVYVYSNQLPLTNVAAFALAAQLAELS
ncbi:hypothetical protein L1D51_21330 [Pseudoalteromonas shioyasakiensis]|uniref:hypothetical protein n=1 Tax=Pseudoalteromonas shioyasakiensis TaxID=1190813 RepID=UPI001EFD00A3|nr:hypothetical protein [Pseudoalteromonas shioyasakiensis]MCG9736496.1 hypothetical protein [Pseudoalteromonas shioyasakiensis]